MNAGSVVIDFHVHMLDRDVFLEASGHNVASGFGARPVRLPINGGANAPSQRSLAKMLAPEPQLEDMDAHGIDINVLSPSTVMQGTAWADSRTALRINQRLNDTVAEWVRAHPARFVGTATLPLQDIDLATTELERAVRELGARLVQLPAQINGIYLGDPAMRPLWEVIAGLDVPVFLHPDGTRDPWFQSCAMWNSIGQPIEECKAMSSMILGGVMDRHPTLSIVIAHGGGFLPHYASRLDRIAATRPETASEISKPPSAYLADFYYDTCVYDPHVLAALIARVGSHRIVMGGDYPVGEADPVAFLNGCESFVPEEEHAPVLGERAAALLRLVPPDDVATR